MFFLPRGVVAAGVIGCAVLIGSAVVDAPGPQPISASSIVSYPPQQIRPSATPQAPTTHTSGVSRSKPQPPVAVTAPYKVRAKACRTGRVVLTFDDGPHPDRTRELITWLTRNDVPATFFIVGSRVSTAPGLVRQLAENPRLFTLANHTWRHPDLRTIPTAQVRASLAATRRAINAHGRAGHLMRPPYGALNQRVLGAVAAERLTPVLWNVDSQDWTGGDRYQIAHRILAQLAPKRANVVLQHDGINNSYESVRAVPIVVQEAKRRGYCFVPLKDDGQAGSMMSPITR